jgi:DHA1 family bicyclomycin/chloramphenicol resistance-like MFS transporter
MEVPLADVAAIRPGLARAAKAPLGFVLLLGALTAFGPLSIDMYLPALPALTSSLHASGAAGQWTVAAFFIGVSMGQLLYGPLSDRYGRRRPLLFGIWLYIAATLGCMLAPSIQALIAFRVVQALGGCAGMVIARAIVRDRFDHDQVLHVFSLLMLVMGVAPILAPLLGGWVLLVADWRWIFGLQLVFAVIVGAASLATLTESRSAETAAHARSENAFRSYAALLGDRRLLGYLLTGAFSGAALFTYVSSSPDVVIGFFHISPQLFGWVFGLNAVGFIAANQINARLARRYPYDTILAWANMAIFGVSLVLLADAVTGFGGLFGVLIPLFLIMSGFGFNQSNSSTGALNIDSRRAGATSALLGAASFGTGATCAGLAGFLRDGSPRPMALVIAGSLLIAVVALRTLVLRPSR